MVHLQHQLWRIEILQTKFGYWFFDNESSSHTWNNIFTISIVKEIKYTENAIFFTLRVWNPLDFCTDKPC